MPRVEWSFFMPAEDHRQVKWLNAHVQSRLTHWGQMIFLVFFVSLAISSVGTQISAYLLIAFITGLIFTAYFLALFFKPKVEARRLLPPPSTAGQHCIYKVVVKNTGKKPLKNLAVFEQCLPYGLYADLRHPEFKNTISWLAPGKETTVTLVLRTPRRGMFEINKLVCGSSFPSGIYRRVRRVGHKETFITYPKMIPPPELPAHLQHQIQPGGLSLSSKTGDSNEFASTRDYREGDRWRDIHWASSARTGKLIVKEFIEEYFVRVGIFMDTELKKFEKHKCFETQVSLCAGMAEALTQNDTLIDLFIGGSENRRFQFGESRNRLNHILEILASLEGERSHHFRESFQTIQNKSAKLSCLIVFLRDYDPIRSAFVQQLKDLNIPLKIIIVRDKPLTVFTDEDHVKRYRSDEFELE